MGQKRSPKLVAIAKRLRNAGHSFSEIAAELSKQGKPISKAAVVNWLRDAGAVADAAEMTGQVEPIAMLPPPKPSPRPMTDAEPDTEPAPDGDAAREMDAAEFATWLAAGLRDARALADAAKAAGDAPGQARAMRLATQLAAVMARQQARAGDEGDVVRVKGHDIDAAAERALTGLRTLADRVLAEVAAWPCCSACGRHVGEFARTDVSPLRAMFERVARGS